MSEECPVSAITPESRELVQLYLRSKSLKEVGAATYSDGELPIRLADAFVLFSNEEIKCDNERHTYESLDAP